MNTKLPTLMLAILLATLCEARATFHLWQIVEVYSNASGTVQFVELLTTSNDQDEFVPNNVSISSSSHTFPFPTNPTSAMTANRRLLIATPGYFALSGVPAA